MIASCLQSEPRRKQHGYLDNGRSLAKLTEFRQALWAGDKIAAFPAGAAVKPSKDELDAKAKHFANTVFLIGAGILMVLANLLQPFAARLMGEELGSQSIFIVATLLIVLLAAKRPDLAVHAIKWQCKKYGHLPEDGMSICCRCQQSLSAPER